MSDTYFGLIQPATNFYIWFGTSMNQENEFERIPPYSMVLIIPGSGHIVGMIWVRQPTSASMEHLCSHLVWTLSCGPNFVAIFHNYILNNLWSLVWHNSDRKLASYLKKCQIKKSKINPLNHLSWNHSFCSRISKGSLDTMK